MGAALDLGDYLLAVVTAGRPAPAWIVLQNELAALSSDSRYRVLDEATHGSVVSEAGHAQATSAAIVEVVEDRPGDDLLTR